MSTASLNVFVIVLVVVLRFMAGWLANVVVDDEEHSARDVETFAKYDPPRPYLLVSGFLTRA